MGKIDFNLPDSLENKLRMEIGRRIGSKRGNFTETTASTECQLDMIRKVKDYEKIRVI